VLIAGAAAAYGSIQFGLADEERALGDLAEALRQDPLNVGARKLLEAIQRRREERQEQSDQQGQEQRSEQQQRQTAEPGDKPPEEDEQQPAGGEEEEQSASEKEADGQDRPEEPPPGQMSQEDAQRLLDALEQQEKGPTRKQPGRRGRRSGPRW